MRTLILASSSPRRRELLALLGIPFQVIAPTVQEGPPSGQDATELASQLAQMKAAAVRQIHRGEVIVAADTVVALRGHLMGKPSDAAAASAMLRDLRGEKHQVITALALRDWHSQAAHVQAVQTWVRMRTYGDEEIAEYIARGEPFDKAGGYAIQDRLFTPVDSIEGCYANVVGLPLCHLYLRLRQVGISLPVAPQRACEAHSNRRCPVAAQVLERGDH